MKESYRIAIGSVFTECNHQVDTLMEIGNFERNELRRGGEVLSVNGGAVGGMLSILREREAESVPLIVASAVPERPLTSECYRQLKGELLGSLKAMSPVDGLLLALHGSATVIDIGDLEGDLLRAVRELVGYEVPIVATLDCHAHVTKEMVRYADVLLAWETYPHRDTYPTGVRGARLLFDILDGKLRPTMAIGKVPVLAGGIHGNTEGSGPFADLMRFAKSQEGVEGVVSTSAFLVHPYLDLPDMGGGGLVVTNNDMSKALSLAEAMAWKYWDRRFDLEPNVYTPTEAISLGMEIQGGPILLVEAADCAGGGATGDSVAALRALVAANVPLSLAPVVDPGAAAECHQVGVGKAIELSLGHKIDPKWGQPIVLKGKVLRLSEGRFRYSGGIWEGLEGHMGPSALFQVGEVQILITTHATYDWGDEQFGSMDLDSKAAKFIVVKNPMNHQLAYVGIEKQRFILDTPGPTPATLKHLRFQRLKRPYYPVDREIPDLTPTLYRGRDSGCSDSASFQD